LTDDFLEEEDDPLDDIQVPPGQDELLETSLVTHIHDNYPWPWPPQDFHERMTEHTTHVGSCRRALLLNEAKLAYRWQILSAQL